MSNNNEKDRGGFLHKPDKNFGYKHKKRSLLKQNIFHWT